MARRSITELSLPIEYSITGFSASATASRMMWMLSASRRCRWLATARSALTTRQCGRVMRCGPSGPRLAGAGRPGGAPDRCRGEGRRDEVVPVGLGVGRVVDVLEAVPEDHRRLGRQRLVAHLAHLVA